MGKFSSRVRRLRSEVREKLDAGTLRAQDLNSLSRRIADLVLRALEDPAHPLSVQMAQMRSDIASSPERVEAWKKLPRKKREAAAQPAALSLMHLFMPQPGNTNAWAREHWRAQLLLLIAARSDQSEKLAKCLRVPPAELDAAAQEAMGSSTALASPEQTAGHLIVALDLLDWTDPRAALRVESGKLCQGPNSVKLSKQEHAFIELLIDNAGGWVRFADFVDVGVPNPTKVKHRLMKKAASAEIELDIREKDQAYMLIDSDD